MTLTKRDKRAAIIVDRAPKMETSPGMADRSMSYLTGPVGPVFWSHSPGPHGAGQRQTAVTDYWKSEQLLLFVFTWQTAVTA